MEHLQRDIERFSGSDLQTAQEAFTRLSKEAHPVLHRYLLRMRTSEAEREDIISTTLVRIWERRETFRAMGVRAWWAYLCTTARHCSADSSRKQDPTELVDEMSLVDKSSIETAAAYRNDREKLYRLADELWLGIESDVEERERRRRLLAAQLFYLHGQSWQDIRDLLGVKTLTREILDKWLSSDPVLRDLSFRELFIENEALIALLLGDDNDGGGKQSTAIEKKDQALPQWSEVEIRVIYYRYLNMLYTEKIAQLLPELNRQTIQEVFDRCQDRLPYASRAKKLMQSFKEKQVSATVLSEAGLWKRLAFGYHSHYEMPLKQISERLEPASSTVGFHLSDAMLTAWISNGRLFSQLAKYAEARLAG